MPVWHEATRKYRESGDLVVMGVIQEQHAERCRLYAQWQKIEWPIVQDSINQLSLRAVPIVMALDEHGVVRKLRRTSELEGFMAAKFSAPEELSPETTIPDLKVVKQRLKQAPSSDKWIALGDALLLWNQDAVAAQKAYSKAIELDPQSAPAHFRQGVAYRMLFDNGESHVDDFRSAVRSWTRALELNPNQYIFRRRIQQYGPRLEKPYPFYDWVELATREIKARGEQPVNLTVALTGSEMAQKLSSFQAEPAGSNPDPKGLINRDSKKFISVRSVIVPSTVQAGRSGRVHVYMEPNKSAHWNNGSGPVIVWAEGDEGVTIDRQSMRISGSEKPESTETRRFEFEVKRAKGAGARVRGYALYYVCENEGGTCLYLRQDFVINLDASRG